jgi:hypothetical protein
MQSVSDCPPEVVAMRPRSIGGRGELENAFAIISGSGIKEGRGGSVTSARNAVAVKAVPPIQTISPVIHFFS